MNYFRCDIGGGGKTLKLTVTCDADFARKIITFTDGTTTITKTCPATSPYQVVFNVPNGGTWTVSGVISGVTLSTTVVIPSSAELRNIPNGATVTPVNDVQTWLHCANIWDKNYTTLDEVLADTTTLLALISSNNADDYMARSTAWAGQNRNLVPKMTSDTTPSGEVIYSSVYGAFYGWYAFGQYGINNNYFWNGKSSDANAYIGYHFTNPVVITKMVFQAPQSYQCNFRNASIQGSNDGTTWVDLKTGITDLFSLKNASVTHTFNNTTAYSYYRLYEASNGEASQHLMAGMLMYGAPGVVDNQTAMGYIGNNDYCAEALLANATWLEAIVNSEYIESVLTTKVPTMTSNTTPSGECIESGHYSSSYAFLAFDGLDNTSWAATEYATNAWVGYKFTSNVCVCAIRLKHLRIVTFKIEGSNDGTNWTDISTTFSTIGDDNMYSFINATKYQYYRLHYLSTTVAEGYIYTLQFYGRA